jgi:hypothetical protein
MENRLLTEQVFATIRTGHRSGGVLAASVFLLLFTSAGFGQMFTTGAQVSAGKQPSGIAAGDFNDDGTQDFVFTNPASNNVTVQLGNGAGSFAEAAGSPITVGNHPQAVAIGDFDRDGRLDLAVANGTDNTISILLGTGAGGFAAAGAPLPVGTSPSSIAVADFNRDGNADLAVANAGGGVTVLLGNGTGGFSTATGSPFLAAAHSTSVGVADFNGDGKADLAFTDSVSSGVRIMTGNGSGGFTEVAHGSYATNGVPVSLAIGDFNGDSKADLVTANLNATVTVLLGDGGGGFGAAAGNPIATSGQGTFVVAGDVNGDGNTDLTVANGTAGTITVLIGDGSGGFSQSAPGGNVGVGTKPVAMMLADFNGDGQPDLAICNLDTITPSYGVGIYLNNLPALTINPRSVQLLEGSVPTNPSLPNVGPSPAFTVTSAAGPLKNISVTGSQPGWLGNATPNTGPTGTPLATSFQVATSLAPGNYTGAVRATAPGYFGATAKVNLRSTGPAGTLTASAASPIAVGVNNRVIAVSDFNNDGKQDFVVGGAGGQLSVFLGNGSGGFTAASGSPFGAAMDPIALVTGDFNNDGNADVAVANASLNTVSVWLGNGAGGFTAGPGSPYAAGTQPSAIVSGDFNGDGNCDMAVTNLGSNNVTVLLGNGLGRFRGATGSPFAVGSQPVSVAAADFNGDGKTDLAIGNRGDSTFTVLLATGNSFAATGASPVTVLGSVGGVRAIAAMPGGSSINLAVAGPSSGVTFTGDGSGNFVLYNFLPRGTMQNAVATADFDGDGNPDLAIAGAEGTNILRIGSIAWFGSIGADFPVGAGAAGVATADFNNDGTDDVAVVNASDGTVSVLLAGYAEIALSLTVPANMAVGSVPAAVGTIVVSGPPRLPSVLPLVGLWDGTRPLTSFLGFPDKYVVNLPSDQTVTVGSHTVIVSTTATARFSAATSNTATILVTPFSQTITFNAVGPVVLGAPFAATATASSGLPVTITSQTPSVCSVTGTTVTTVTVGSCSLLASQPGDNNYAAASQAMTFSIVRGPYVYIDSPVGNAALSGTATIQGWAVEDLVTAGPAISTVDVYVDNVKVNAGSVYGTPRADVCAAFPGLGCPNVGWSYDLNTSALTVGSHTLKIVATDTNNLSNFSQTTFNISKTPYVYIDSPAANATLTGTTTIQGWALEDLTSAGLPISAVDVYVDNVKVNTGSAYGTPRADVCAAFPGRSGCPNVGWSYNLNTSALAPGSHTLKIVATDTNNLANFSQATFNTSKAPYVYIDSPAANATLTGTTTIQGWAIEDLSSTGLAVSTVDVYVDNVKVNTGNAYGAPRADVCTAFPGRPGCPNVGWSYNLNTSALAPGSHTLKIVATDTNNISGFSQNAFTVPQTPYVYIDYPFANMTLDGTVTVKGWAIEDLTSPGLAVSTVDVYVDNVKVNSGSVYGTIRGDVCAAYPPGRPGCPNVGWSYNLNTYGLGNGSHVLKIVATDTGNNIGMSQTTFNISRLPFAFIDSPTANAVFSGTATFDGWALENVGSIGLPIATVDVYVDNVKVNTGNTYGTARADVCVTYSGRPGCPNVGWSYSLDTAALATGVHTLKVVATDIANNTGASQTVPFYVSRLPFVYIDSPTPNAILSGTTTVMGWALEDLASIGFAVSAVDVYVDNLKVNTGNVYGTPRADVCAAFPGRVGCPNVGWSYDLDTSALAAGNHTLKIVATDSAGYRGSSQVAFVK